MISDHFIETNCFLLQKILICIYFCKLKLICDDFSISRSHPHQVHILSVRTFVLHTSILIGQNVLSCLLIQLTFQFRSICNAIELHTSFFLVFFFLINKNITNELLASARVLLIHILMVPFFIRILLLNVLTYPYFEMQEFHCFIFLFTHTGYKCI